MKVDKTAEIAIWDNSIKELEAKLTQAKTARGEAVLKSYQATGPLQLGDIVLYRGKKAKISKIIATYYSPPEVKLFVRKQLKSGELGNQDFEVWASMDGLKKVEE